MSSASFLRGGIRLSASSSALLQSVGVRSSRVSRRHIVSLGLTSVCQVMLKKRALMDANVQPVNKYHLANDNSLTSAVAVLFSADDLTSLDNDDDLEESPSISDMIATRVFLTFPVIKASYDLCSNG